MALSVKSIGSRVRGAGSAAVRRVRSHGFSLLLAATAAGIAFFLASLIVGPQNAVFAPVAAVVATGLSAGQRIRRATEISVGVVLGIMAADLLSQTLGVGPLQLAAAILLAMAAAVAVRPSGLMANQAAVAAVVVVALVPYLDAGPWVRAVDALIGGVVAVVLNALIPSDPYRSARAVTKQVLAEYVRVLGRLRTSIQKGSLPEAESALGDMEALDNAGTEISEALAATRERVILSRTARNQWQESLQTIEAVSGRLVILVATGRGLCRAGANLVRHTDGTVESGNEDVRQGFASALEELIEALENLQGWLDDTGELAPVRELALQAARTAAEQRPRTQASAMLVGQIRSATVDILRITGLEQAAAVAELEKSAGRADEGEIPGA